MTKKQLYSLAGFSYLLTVNNPKLQKCIKQGVFAAVLHLAPHKLSGRNICKWATPGCIAACLNFAGQGGIGTVTDGKGNLIVANNCQQVRIKRTKFFFDKNGLFMKMLDREIETHARRARKKGYRPAVRLNGTSDLWWGDVAKQHPDVQFYDYTKDPQRCMRVRCEGITNYHVLYSRSETPGSHRNALRHLELGFDVAVVFEGPELPDTWHGFPVYNGDEHDVRFDSPGGMVCGLIPKGSLAKKDTTGFVVRG